MQNLIITRHEQVAVTYWTAEVP